jgi:hypothetical protein
LHGLGNGQHAFREQTRDSSSETRFGGAPRALATQSIEGDACGLYGGLERLARRLETRVLGTDGNANLMIGGCVGAVQAAQRS